MSALIKTRIIKIGNSQGVRIPKLLLRQSKLGEEVELEAQTGQIVIRPTTQPRQHWEAAFAEMAANGDDQLLDHDTSLSQWDEEEWQW